MRVVYLESSAFLAWLLEQKSGSEVARRIAGVDQIVSSVLTVAEANRVVRRAETAKLVSEVQCRALLGRIANESSRWQLFGLTPAIISRLAEGFPVEPVTTLDGIHLGTALELVKGYPELEVLSLDTRINENLQALGWPSPGK